MQLEQDQKPKEKTKQPLKGSQFYEDHKLLLDYLIQTDLYKSLVNLFQGFGNALTNFNNLDVRQFLTSPSDVQQFLANQQWLPDLFEKFEKVLRQAFLVLRQAFFYQACVVVLWYLITPAVVIHLMTLFSGAIGKCFEKVCSAIGYNWSKCFDTVSRVIEMLFEWGKQARQAKENKEQYAKLEAAHACVKPTNFVPTKTYKNTRDGQNQKISDTNLHTKQNDALLRHWELTPPPPRPPPLSTR